MDNDILVVSAATGATYVMNEDQIEAAYRYQERHYREMDARCFIDERLERVNGDKEEFEKEYGVSYDDVIEDVDYLALWRNLIAMFQKTRFGILCWTNILDR